MTYDEQQELGDRLWTALVASCSNKSRVPVVHLDAGEVSNEIGWYPDELPPLPAEVESYINELERDYYTGALCFKGEQFWCICQEPKASTSLTWKFFIDEELFEALESHFLLHDFAEQL